MGAGESFFALIMVENFLCVPSAQRLVLLCKTFCKIPLSYVKFQNRSETFNNKLNATYFPIEGRIHIIRKHILKNSSKKVI